MNDRLPIERRGLLLGAAALALGSGCASARPSPTGGRLSVRVASNQGAENATIQQLMADRGFADQLGLDVEVVESRVINGPMDALVAGEADICMISGFVGVLPAIAQGQPLRLVGAAMLLPALAVYTTRGDIRRVDDLAGRRVGVGGTNGLLHILALALLRRKGVDASKIEFVNAGSNAQVLEAVAAGKVDAGLSGPAGLSNAATRVLDDGRLWQELPEYTYQPAYASLRAIRDKPEALGRCLAAYTRLYRFLSRPESRAPYLDARRRAAGAASVAEGQAVWDFIQRYRPYATDVGLSRARVDYLQQLNRAVGLQRQVLAYEAVADLAPAMQARRFL